MEFTDKGQVTIPTELRRRHGFVEGSDVEVTEEEGELHTARTDAFTAGQRAVQRVRGIGGKGLSANEIMAMTRGE